MLDCRPWLRPSAFITNPFSSSPFFSLQNLVGSSISTHGDGNLKKAGGYSTYYVELLMSFVSQEITMHCGYDNDVENPPFLPLGQCSSIGGNARTSRTDLPRMASPRHPKPRGSGTFLFPPQARRIIHTHGSAKGNRRLTAVYSTAD